MREAEVKVVNRLGLHARPAARLVRLTSRFKGSVRLHDPIRNVEADAGSILSILTLSASMGTVLLVKAEGEDQNPAIEAVKDFFESGFGEQ